MVRDIFSAIAGVINRKADAAVDRNIMYLLMSFKYALLRLYVRINFLDILYEKFTVNHNHFQAEKFHVFQCDLLMKQFHYPPFLQLFLRLYYNR